MERDEAQGILQFLEEAERLKNVYRTSWTSGGQLESTASHTWRLCLIALIVGDYMPEIDIGKLLKICMGVATLYFADLSTVGPSRIYGVKSANNH